MVQGALFHSIQGRKREIETYSRVTNYKGRTNIQRKT
jgi:hypothetical protein